MAANLASPGLLPAAAHPDAELFAMTAKSKARHGFGAPSLQALPVRRRIARPWTSFCNNS